ncbi:hypothetical protein ACIBEJ_47470 [Nonomuraea sp. NPDC050790]|uniref:hypothetical protein n=1 Tax=Nonomuraea sp. NPDC050790 TaxID=3364371 RepID=UPI0037A6667F
MITDHLGEVDLPTLLTSGCHNELTPMRAEVVRDGIPGSRSSTTRSATVVDGVPGLHAGRRRSGSRAPTRAAGIGACSGARPRLAADDR